MAKRALLLLALVCAVAAPAALAGDNYGDQKASVDAKLGQLHAKIARAQAQESRLSSQIGGLTTQIQTLERQVGDVSTRLASLQSDLALHQRRLDKLNELYKLQTTRFRYLRHEYKLALQRLNLRLVDIYKQDEPTTVDVILAARSFSDVIDQLDYLGAIAAQDKSVAAQVATAKHQITVQRARTKKIRRGVQQEATVINARVQQAAILRGELLSSRSNLAGARSSKSHALVITRKQVQDEIQESQALAAASAQLAAKLRAGRDAGGGRGRRRQLVGRRRRPARASSGRCPGRSRARSGCAGARSIRASTSACRPGRPSTRRARGRSSGAAGCPATGTS